MRPLPRGISSVLAGAVLLLLTLFSPSGASAASSSFGLGEQAVVQVWVGTGSELAIRGSERATIDVESDDETVQVGRRPVAFGTVQNPLSVTIPPIPIRTRDASGNAVTETLAPEDFPYAGDFRPGVHDTVRIVTAPGSHTTVSLPATTAILDARIRGAGILSISDYHGGTLFVGTGGGRTTLSDVTSVTYLQALNGRVALYDSTFPRIRVRTNTASVVFERCRATQVEATTISGAIVYDNGTFEPGLARFESQSGAIAIGVAGGAQLAARSADGRVLGLWDRRTTLDQRGENEVTATVAGGGPVVNAIAGRGNIFLYDGSLAARRTVPEHWRPLAALLRAPAASRPSLATPRRLPGANHERLGTRE